MKRFKKHWFSVAMVMLVITLFTGGIMFKRGGWQVDFDPQCRLHFLRTKP
jgi:cytochrome b subunit of formate dehydrogenase